MNKAFFIAKFISSIYPPLFRLAAPLPLCRASYCAGLFA